MNSEQEHIEKLRSAYEKRLRILELKEAQQGYNTPAEVLMEITDLQNKIEALDRRLQSRDLPIPVSPSPASFQANWQAGMQRIEIVLRGDFSRMTPEIQAATVRAIAALAEIPVEQIAVLKVMSGSIIFELAVPPHAAERLIEMYQEENSLVLAADIERIELLPEAFDSEGPLSELAIGLGGIGTEIIRKLKGFLQQDTANTPRNISFLAIDTEPHSDFPGKTRLYDKEFVYLGDYDISRAGRVKDSFKDVPLWWPGNSVPQIGNIHYGARANRIAGHFSLLFKYGEFARKINEKKQEVDQHKSSQSEYSERQHSKSIYIVSSLSGGTGSGVFIDVALKVRNDFGGDANIIGIFILPSVLQLIIQEMGFQQLTEANAFASILELNKYMSMKSIIAHYPGETISVDRPPFDSVYFIESIAINQRLLGIDDITNVIAQAIHYEPRHHYFEQQASHSRGLNPLGYHNIELLSSTIENGNLSMVQRDYPWQQIQHLVEYKQSYDALASKGKEFLIHRNITVVA
jgi:hypothetical protein